MVEQYLIMDSFDCIIELECTYSETSFVVCVFVLQKAFWNPKTEASWERVYSCGPGGKRTCQFLFWKTPFQLYFSRTDTNTCISSICIEGVVCVCVAAGFCRSDCAFHSLFILLPLNKTLIRLDLVSLCFQIKPLWCTAGWVLHEWVAMFRSLI